MSWLSKSQCYLCVYVCGDNVIMSVLVSHPFTTVPDSVGYSVLCSVVVLTEESRYYTRDAASTSCLQAWQTIAADRRTFQVGPRQPSCVRQKSQRAVSARGEYV